MSLWCWYDVNKVMRMSLWCWYDVRKVMRDEDEPLVLV